MRVIRSHTQGFNISTGGQLMFDVLGDRCGFNRFEASFEDKWNLPVVGLYYPYKKGLIRSIV